MAKKKGTPKIKAQWAAQNLCGWAGPDIAKEAFNIICAGMPTFSSIGPSTDYKGKRMMLWEVTRKVIGKDTENYPQEIGDCVSFGGKNVLEYLQCVNIVLNGAAAEFHPVFPPYFYGTSRVFVGGGRIWGDGSTGAWLQDAIKKYGVLRSDDPSVPQYAGSVARQWGSSGPPKQFVTEGQKYLVKTTAQVNSADDVANSLLSGYPVAVCSNYGFNMTASSDGFHAPRGTWGHCMSIIGFEDHPQYGLYFIILNSWGDVHGRLKDFTSGEDLPIGILRVKAATVNKMVAQQDSFSYSQFDGFPDNSDKLNIALFDIIGS